MKKSNGQQPPESTDSTSVAMRLPLTKAALHCAEPFSPLANPLPGVNSYQVKIILNWLAARRVFRDCNTLVSFLTMGLI
jgi:hypothetical protein